MGQAKRRGTLEQRKAEAEFYQRERKRLDEWLKHRRPRVSFTNSHGTRSQYFSMLSLSALQAWAETQNADVIIHG